MEAAVDWAHRNVEMKPRGGALRGHDAPFLRRLEDALHVVRTYLLECALHDEWGEQSSAQLTEIVLACVGQVRDHDAAAPLRDDGRLPERVLRQVVRFVKEHLDTKLRWHDIAGEVGMERFAFARGFKLSTGLTVHQYVIRCRLRRAMHLLLNDELGLSEIAVEVGFSCQSHMTTLFRKHLGTTPGALRMGASHGAKRRAARVPGSQQVTRSPAAIASASPIHLVHTWAGATSR